MLLLSFPFYKLFFFILGGMFFQSCARDINPLSEIVNSKTDEIQRIMQNEAAHEVQILYTQIARDEEGNPHFTNYRYGLAGDYYFYPASTAKLPVAILALQKINALQQQGIPITKATPFRIDDPQTGASIAVSDSTAQDGRLSVAHLIKKIFLVSDNEAYNYLFDFLGVDYINAELKSKGLLETRLYHKFSAGADNKRTWDYLFFSGPDTLYHQPSIVSQWEGNHKNLKGVLKGQGYLQDGKQVAAPMDFSQKNRISLSDLNGILMRIIFPEHFPTAARFGLTANDLDFLRYWMSRNTLESTYPNYTDDAHWDSYVKFFIYGDRKGAMTDTVRIYNKVGYAYGTLTDVAYVQDTERGIEFMLAATVLVNDNQIFNDDVYAFESKGIPFLAALGREVYAYEKRLKTPPATP